MNGEGDHFVGGTTFGALLVITFLIAVWHVEESVCQKAHNVADCVLAENAFVPAAPSGEEQ